MTAASTAEGGYDLVDAAGDFPAWTGSPRRTVLICSHPRSGTTLLGEQIYGLGGLGLPLEYFHRGFRPHLQRRWSAEGLEDYARTVHRWRTDPSGVFSVKLFWQDVEEVAHERDPAGQPPFGQTPPGSLDDDAYRKKWALLADLFPNPVFVYLRREDRIRQAISAMAADQSGMWRSIPGVGRRNAVAPITYDYERIARLVSFSDYCHGHWARLFAAIGARAYAMTYEALDSAMATEVQALARYLGRPGAAIAEPRTRRQSNAETEVMVLRFLRDNAIRGDA